MTTVKDIYEHINGIAPYSWQESYDNSGLCVGDSDREVTKALIALDVTKDIIAQAQQEGAQLIITHHPVIFRALKSISSTSAVGMLLSSGISALSAHTNFDSAVMNDILCKKLSLVPAGAICEENGVGMGCVCELEKEMTAKELADHVRSRLGNVVVRYNDLEKTAQYKGKKLTRAAVCSGSGASFKGAAIAKGCDVLITGDVKHDVFIDAQNEGFCVMDAGHFHTENIFCEYMKNELSQHFKEVEFAVAQNNVDVVSYSISK